MLMLKFRFWHQNSLGMANIIKNLIILNLKESGKNKKIASNVLTTFFVCFYSYVVTKTAVRASKNSSKR
jgi:hypothetical protein